MVWDSSPVVKRESDSYLMYKLRMLGEGGGPRLGKMQRLMASCKPDSNIMSVCLITQESKL